MHNPYTTNDYASSSPFLTSGYSDHLNPSQHALVCLVLKDVSY